jgi:hypothetical protein
METKHYFDVIPADDLPQWFLDVPIDATGNDCDPWPFMAGRRLESYSPLTMPIADDGPAMDFSFAAFGIPVVAPELGMRLQELAGEDVQLIPVTLQDGRSISILVATRRVDCLDHQRSAIQYYSEEHAADIGRPEKVGKPNMVLKLVIDSARTEDRKVLRIKDWEGPLIVREDIARAMQQWEVTGVGFLSVTP